MKQNNLSVKKLCMLVVAGMIFSMLAITVILGVVMKDVRIFSLKNFPLFVDKNYIFRWFNGLDFLYH